MLSRKAKKLRSRGNPSVEARDNDIRVAAWLGMALFFFYLLTTSAHRPYGDELEYLAVAEGILSEGTPGIMQTQLGPDEQPRGAVIPSKFSLGQSLFALPFLTVAVIAGKALPAELSFFSPLILNSLPAAESAALCAFLFLLIRLLGRSRTDLFLSSGTALLVALTTGIATQIWPSSRTLFVDTTVAFLLTFAIYSLVRFRYSDSGVGWAITSAWAAAMMVLCKTLLFLACPGLAAYGFWAVVERKKSDPSVSHKSLVFLLSMATLPFLLIAAIQLWHNYWRYGSIWLFGYHEGQDGEFGFSTPILAGLYGIFLSSGRSLFLYSPPSLLAFIGARVFLRSAPAETALLAATSLPVLLAYAKWWSWHGGWEWGNRFFLFLIPLLMWISVSAWRWMDQASLSVGSRRLRQVPMALLVLISLYVQGLGVLIHPGAYWTLTANELRLLEHPIYEKGKWEIRDDMPLAHFVPEFSPLAAHNWLVWATWNRSKLDDRALATSAPWYSLNPKWAPNNVGPYLGFDLWFYGEFQGQKDSEGYAILMAGLLAAIIILCLIRLRPLVRHSGSNITGPVRH